MNIPAARCPPATLTDRAREPSSAWPAHEPDSGAPVRYPRPDGPLERSQRQLPDWPGFHRLTLSPDELVSLDGCREELDDLMGAVGQRFSKVTLTSQDGITHFRAERVAAPPPRFSAAWWFQGVERVGSVLTWMVIGGIVVWLCVALLRAAGLVS